mmetsp:Transcript_38397/g.43839  ORF Transcript_38397/g.43839 Transcript_38397/m.43839 type:complete len:144 (+) Transcript_38397:2-433(+)|eukprot:CAMPEP_0194130356 /NCGR_PEP_ID=MMETSP0152-20130528/1415_1 /TAXON_ID=1049557 /ORGANISM="Thalassiothrix antarctica, Strain L6-D1" /LENGTH=143 /DNA_ID=CAMNT_0038824845 /DNA_START=74 /DNA_END=505 /DNA_ORIENTATION=-
MMKLATIISALIIGSAIAFAPIQTGGKSFQQLQAAAVAQPSPQSLGFFDTQAGNELLGVFNNVEEKLDVASAECNRAIGAASRAFSPALFHMMKVASSIGSKKNRSKDCQIVRRRGRIYLISKKNPKIKTRQGGAKMKKRQKK